MAATRKIAVRVVEGDALALDSDVLVLKYAQELYGVDKAVCARLNTRRPITLPSEGNVVLEESGSLLAARQVLFIGVPPLADFGYAGIRDFGRQALASLANRVPCARHVALTLHGPGFGLDEIEAFRSELAGIGDAISAGDMPDRLETVSFVERNQGRTRRLLQALKRLLPDGGFTVGASVLNEAEKSARKALGSAGSGSSEKPHVFVAMPFAEEMDDIFHYGIQGPVNAAGLLCERADLAAFTGDVLDWVKARIAGARLVVADLSGANANVYLEVGYAWGCRVPTVLLAKEGNELKFDVRGQRCILYKSIKQLEQSLGRELKGLLGL